MAGDSSFVKELAGGDRWFLEPEFRVVLESVRNTAVPPCPLVGHAAAGENRKLLIACHTGSPSNSLKQWLRLCFPHFLCL